jgi:hypothetical protein
VQHALKNESAVEYTQLDTETEHEFLVSGDKTEIEKLATRGQLTNEGRGNIERNVGHLKIVVASTEITESGEDITDLHSAIAAGEQALENNPA